MSRWQGVLLAALLLCAQAVAQWHGYTHVHTPGAVEHAEHLEHLEHAAAHGHDRAGDAGEGEGDAAAHACMLCLAVHGVDAALPVPAAMPADALPVSATAFRPPDFLPPEAFPARSARAPPLA
jgi:hypothetical protein